MPFGAGGVVPGRQVSPQPERATRIYEGRQGQLRTNTILVARTLLPCRLIVLLGPLVASTLGVKLRLTSLSSKGVTGLQLELKKV